MGFSSTFSLLYVDFQTTSQWVTSTTSRPDSRPLRPGGDQRPGTPAARQPDDPDLGPSPGDRPVQHLLLRNIDALVAAGTRVDWRQQLAGRRLDLTDGSVAAER